MNYHLDKVPRLAVEGSAGTGKTVIAMEKARRLSREDKRVLLLCFNKPLAEDLQRSAKGFEVSTFHDFAFRLAQRAGLDPAVPDGRTRKRRFYDEELPLLALDAIAPGLDGYHLLHATRGAMLARLGQSEDAKAAYQRAADLAPTDPDRRFLARQIGEVAAG